MHLRLGINLIALSCFFGLHVRASNQTIDAPPSIWHMDDPAQIGGHIATVLGHPQTLNESAGKSIQFDGANDGLLLPLNPLEGFSEFTIEVLFKPDREGPVEQRFLHVQDNLGSRGLLELRLTKEGWPWIPFCTRRKMIVAELNLISPNCTSPTAGPGLLSSTLTATWPTILTA